jgi:hypothetical protein
MRLWLRLSPRVSGLRRLRTGRPAAKSYYALVSVNTASPAQARRFRLVRSRQGVFMTAMSTAARMGP